MYEQPEKNTHWRNEYHCYLFSIVYGAFVLFITVFTNLLISPNDAFFSRYYCPCFRPADTQNINVT